jgi:hypothetical protein
VRVVPLVGGDSLDFSFEERILPDPESGGGGCVHEAVVRVSCGWWGLGRLVERFISSTSKVKVAERDAYLLQHFAAEDGAARAAAVAAVDAMAEEAVEAVERSGAAAVEEAVEEACVARASAE